MPFLTDLPIADLRVAGDAVETVIEFAAYLPDERSLIAAGQWRDDIRAYLGMRSLEPAHGVAITEDLAALEDAGLHQLANAVGTLAGRFTRYMDAALVTSLSGLDAELHAQLTRRAHLQAVRPS